MHIRCQADAVMHVGLCFLIAIAVITGEHHGLKPWVDSQSC